MNIMLKYIMKFMILMLLINLTIANPISINAVDESVLLSCQATGHTLYSSCVVKPPSTPDEVAVCGTLKTTYLICLTKLTIPYLLTPSLETDPYSYSPFTPCGFETGHLILFDICPNSPV